MYEAYVQRLWRSAPEYPFVREAISSISASLSSNALFCAVWENNYRRPSLLGRGMYSLFTNLLLTASSSYSGRLVAPMINTLSSLMLLAPSSCTRNSVLILRVESSSF